jgi:3-phenylpropionate/trans-cinnamate dioxygenase ferredoxin component
VTDGGGVETEGLPTAAGAGASGPADDAARVAPTPAGLAAPGTAGGVFRPLLPVADLPAGAMRRVSIGDLDILLAYTSAGIVATDDRCPHMAAPLSLGRLDGCAVACPLHRGAFDLATGEAIQLPTTGGLDADGTLHPTWSPPGTEPKPDPPGSKADARRLTRTRRIRFYAVRIAGASIEVALPVEVTGPVLG